MKAKFTLLTFFVAAFFAANAQQVPNESFDSWTIDTLAPDGWSTYESFFGLPIGHAEKDAVDKVAGPYSLKLTSDSVPGFGSYGVLAGLCALGSAAPGFQPDFPGAPFAFKPDTLFTLYKYTSPGADSPIIAMKLLKGGTSVIGHPVYGLAFLFPPSSQWAAGFIPITQYYTSGDTPDSLSLEFYSSKNPAPNGGIKGSVLHVDGVLFGYVTLPNSLQEVADRLNITIYPNPATNFITVSSDENTEGFRAVVSDISGKIVSVNELSGNKTMINVSGLANGTYIYRIADKTGNILKQDRFNVVK